MRKAQRRYVTLIEVMIVMSLLAILAGVTGISIRRAVLEERYHAGVAELAGRLQMAQDIMLIVRSDVSVRLNQQPDGLLCHLETTQPLLPVLQRIITRSGVIRGINSFTWTPVDGRSVTNQPVTLNFKSSGPQASRGELKVSAGAVDNYILLSGFAEPIQATPEPRIAQLQKSIEANPSLERLYPNEVRIALEPFMEQLSRQKNRSSGLK